ncbi:MAG: hypothetical protein ACTSW2_00540 [Alphaproteobacteria bacterium]
MPYVVRDASGQIVKLLAEKSSECTEELLPGDPALQAFLSRAAGSGDLQNALSSSDLDMIRVIEDLIAVLIDKRIIVLTDLPLQAQQKLSRRYELRSKLTDLAEIVADMDEVSLP